MNELTPDRRRFLQLLAFGVGGGLLGCAGPTNGSGADAAGATPAAADGSRPASTAPRAPSPGGIAAASDRTLVVIELEGGNDGLDTLVPLDEGAYRRLRGDIGHDFSTLLPLDDEVAWSPRLERLAARGLTTVEGVGTLGPELSHTESAHRWYSGDPAGTLLDGSGFLGRLCDVLDAGAPVTGVSISFAPSPILRSASAVTAALPDADGGWMRGEDPFLDAFRDGLRAMSSAPGTAPQGHRAAARGLDQAMAFLDVLADLPEPSETMPGSELGTRLALTSRLLAADAGIRVVHVPYGGFDTHEGHRWQHDELLGQFDEAVDAFLADLDMRGLADRTLVATISEFGRRPQANAGGTDHGSGSVALLAGPLGPARLGAYPSLQRLDDAENLQVTVPLDQYYGGLAESWFEVPADEVLSSRPEVLALL